MLLTIILGLIVVHILGFIFGWYSARWSAVLEKEIEEVLK